MNKNKDIRSDPNAEYTTEYRIYGMVLKIVINNFRAKFFINDNEVDYFLYTIEDGKTIITIEDRLIL